MTDDLVVRLRGLLGHVTDSGCNALRIEAAAEIERLRAENARLKDLLRQANFVCDVFAEAVVVQAIREQKP